MTLALKMLALTNRHSCQAGPGRGRTISPESGFDIQISRQ